MSSKKDLKFSLVLGKKAEKYIEKLEARWRDRVLEILDQMTNNPFEGDIETIKGKAGYYRRRIGGFRLKYVVSMDKKEIRVLDFGPKGDFKY